MDLVSSLGQGHAKKHKQQGSVACALLVLGRAVGGVEVVICSLGGIQDMAGARAS